MIESTPSRRLHVSRSVCLLGASLGATTVAMALLQRVAERIG